MVATVALSAGPGLGFAEIVEDPLLPTAAAVSELKYGVQLGAVALGFVSESRGVDLELVGVELRLEETCATEPLAGYIEAFDGVVSDEDGEGCIDGHGVGARTQMLAEVIA